MKSKYFILVIILIITLFIFSSCGNRQVGIDTVQTFKRAYIRLGETWTEVSVKGWRDFDNGDEIQIATIDGKVYLTHYCNVILVNE